MMELGNHGGFIVAAYLAATIVVVGLIGWTLRDGRILRRQLANLESRGIRRRSAKGGESN
jgi:heme exporter protein D